MKREQLVSHYRTITKKRGFIRKLLSVALTLLLTINLVPGAFAAESMAAQISALPAGSAIEIRLKNKDKMRGVTGLVSPSGFTLVDASKAGHEIAFNDVASFKKITKSHTTRNVLIGVGIGVAALGIAAAVVLRCAPLGCGKTI